VIWWRRMKWESKVLVLAILGLLATALCVHILGR
jgi:hypothetical protein